jgi:hypothetical protein
LVTCYFLSVCRSQDLREGSSKGEGNWFVHGRLSDWRVGLRLVA